MSDTKKLIDLLLSDYGKALCLIILPVIVIFPPLHDSPKIYNLSLFIIIVFNIILMIIKKKVPDLVAQGLSWVFPLCGIVIALIAISSTILNWSVVAGMLVLTGVLEATVLKPEDSQN